jgi:hypothetical protein
LFLIFVVLLGILYQKHEIQTCISYWTPSQSANEINLHYGVFTKKLLHVQIRGQGSIRERGIRQDI